MSPRKLKALITCEVNDGFLHALEERGIQFELAGWGQTGITLTDSEVVAKAEDCNLLIIEIEGISRDILLRLPKVRFIGVSRGNPVNVDLEYCKEFKIKVVHTPGRNADSVADYCVGSMIDISRGLSASRIHLSMEGWMFEEKLPYLEFRGREIGHQTVGLYGMGNIGKRVAKRLNAGFGTKVIYFDPFVAADENAKRVESLDALFTQSDIVSLHAPVVDSTRNTVDRALLSKLGPSGFLISSARAQIIDEDDLYLSLVEHEIAGAVLDVYWREPIDQSSRWLQLANVICTPHVAGASLDVVNNHCSTILKGIDDWLGSPDIEER